MGSCAPAHADAGFILPRPVHMDISHSPFADRRDAGRKLAAAVAHLRSAHLLVLALPRGGVPVGYEVAQSLGAPLDVLLVRKIGVPGYPELGLGAIVDGAAPCKVMNQDVMDYWKPSAQYLADEERRQLAEIERRRRLYCGERSPFPVHGRTVLVVDDGIATGGTLKTALKALAGAGVKRLVFAVPVAPATVLDELRKEADEGICLLAPPDFRAVSLYYADFEQTTDEEVIRLLGAATARRAPIANEENHHADDFGSNDA